MNCPRLILSLSRNFMSHSMWLVHRFPNKRILSCCLCFNSLYLIFSYCGSNSLCSWKFWDHVGYLLDPMHEDVLIQYFKRFLNHVNNFFLPMKHELDPWIIFREALILSTKFQGINTSTLLIMKNNSFKSLLSLNSNSMFYFPRFRPYFPSSQVHWAW